MLNIISIISDGCTLCDKCLQRPIEEKEMKQIQKGLKIYFYCMQCWFRYKHLIMKGKMT